MQGKYDNDKEKKDPSTDSVIEPETSGLKGSVLTFTPPGLLRNLMIKLCCARPDQSGS